MKSQPTLYTFPVNALDFDQHYDRWLFSLCQASNDLTLFQHLVDILIEDQGRNTEPQELQRGEFDSLFFHVIAHTYEALELWFHPSPDIESLVSREKKAVVQKISIRMPDIKPQVSQIQRQWESALREQFAKVRNLLVSHYPSPSGNSRSEQDISDYWLTFRDVSQHEDSREFRVATVFSGDSDTVRFRHQFVDELHQSYLDRLFPPGFRDFEEGQRIAQFIGDVNVILKDLVSELLIRILMRTDRPGGRQLREYRWDEDDQGWASEDEQ